jgi:hypothetical protein
VAVVAANNVWAVGSYVDGAGITQSLVEHWNGNVWTVVPSYATAVTHNGLKAVAAVTANDIWAVGFVSPSGQGQSLLLHWDGLSWSRVTAPTGGTYSGLSGVVALAADDVWAVGFSGFGTHTLHWDGTAWTIIPSPNPATGTGILQAVAAVAPNDVWAVGYSFENPDLHHSLTLHWNGTTWAIVPSPDPADHYNELNAVTASAPNDVWAIGQALPYVPGQYEVLSLHWDGSTWTLLTPPQYGGADNIAYGVTNFGANNVWLVGTYGDTSTGIAQPLTLQRSNSQWTLAHSPNAGNQYNFLIAVAGGAANDIWAAGFYTNQDGIYHTLIEHYTGACGTPTPQPSATVTRTGTPPTATATRTATVTGTGTPPTATPSATVCPVQFNDVPPGSTFYDYVRCLACRGLVGGYPCGGPGEPCPGPYFRPNNDVTRGQLAKIVAQSAGLPDPIPSSQQTIEDVPNSGTFWLWIEQLSGRGVIGGYPCGGPFEPCVGPANRPYFRPNNPATRGQIAKIVSNTAGYTETPTGQTFEDVPVGSPFYLFIERIAARGIVRGYSCGGPGEPCVAPANRPYFRPGNPTTRGQMSKIAANTFLPNCQTPARRRP